MSASSNPGHRIRYTDSTIVKGGGKPRLNEPAVDTRADLSRDEATTKPVVPTFSAGDDAEEDLFVTREAARAANRQQREAAAEINRTFTSENPNHTVAQRRLRFRDTVIDPRIQRAENRAEINAIVREFNPAALGVSTVSCRVDEDGNETFVVLDGQQRRAASLEVGYDELTPFTVHYGLTPEEEARLFRQLNFRRSVSAAVLFKTSLVEGNPVTLAIQAICDGLGIPVGAQNGLMAVDLARRLAHTKEGLLHFRWALEEIQTIFDPTHQGGVYDSRVVEAFAMFHRHYEGKVDVKRLERKLSELGGVHNLIGRGNNVRTFKGGRAAQGIMDAMVERYNHGMHARGTKALREVPRRQANKVTAEVVAEVSE